MGYSARFSEVETNQQRFDRTEVGHEDFNNGSRFREEAYSQSGQDIFRQQSAAQYRSDANFLPVMEIVDGGNASSLAGGSMSNGARGGQSEGVSGSGNDLAMVDRTMRDASTLLSQVEKARGQGGDAGASQAASTPASAADQPAQPAAPASAADQPAQPAAPAAGSGDPSMGSKAVQGIEKLVNQWIGTDDNSTTSDVLSSVPASQQSAMAAPVVANDTSGS